MRKQVRVNSNSVLLKTWTNSNFSSPMARLTCPFLLFLKRTNEQTNKQKQPHVSGYVSKVKSLSEKEISTQFHLPIIAAAKKVRICL